MPSVIRAANSKQLTQIQAEITEAKNRKLQDGEQVLSKSMSAVLLRVFPSLPKFVRAAFWRRFDKNPFIQKRIMFDHDVIDGALAARFVSQLSRMIEQAHGLENLS
jgi:hypothetical protein